MRQMMRMVVTELGSRRGLKLAGELDMSTASLLSDALGPQLAAGGQITLDLSDLKFMDSTGLQVLIRSAVSLGERGILILESPGNLVRSILELAVRTDKIPNLRITDAA